MPHVPWRARVAVTLLARSRTTTLLTEWVGPSNLFIRTDAPPPVMTLVRLELALPPNERPFTAHGKIVNVAHASAGAGVEIAFFAPSDEATRAWDAFLDHLRHAHPEALQRPVTLTRAKSALCAPSVLVDGVREDDCVPASMFLRTSSALAVGSDVRVTLSEPGSWTRIELDAVVRRRVRAEGGDGFGLELRNMAPAAWDELTSFLRGAAGRARAEVVTVRAESAPQVMATLPGPWSKDPKALVRAAGERRGLWSLPPDDSAES